jgi:hypothetical protein
MTFPQVPVRTHPILKVIISILRCIIIPNSLHCSRFTGVSFRAASDHEVLLRFGCCTVPQTVYVINSPSQPRNEAARIVAHDEFARLVQAARKQVNSGIRKDSVRGNVHGQLKAKANVMEIKKCLAGILLARKALLLRGRKKLVRIIRREGGRGSDAQGRHAVIVLSVDRPEDQTSSPESTRHGFLITVD